jgi:hypothetical protein
VNGELFSAFRELICEKVTFCEKIGVKTAFSDKSAHTVGVVENSSDTSIGRPRGVSCRARFSAEHNTSGRSVNTTCESVLLSPHLVRT